MTEEVLKAKRKVKHSPANALGWHVVKLDDQSYKALTEYRDDIIATGRHASYSDAIRQLLGDNKKPWGGRRDWKTEIKQKKIAEKVAKELTDLVTPGN